MIARLNLALSLFVGCLCAAPHSVAVRNVTVVDVERGVLLPGRTIVVRGELIEAVAVNVPSDAVIVNGTGKFAIPGLWDMHVHLWFEHHQFPRYLANGVTGVRDMGSDFRRVSGWRKNVEAGVLLGPHVETCGSPLDGVASGDAKLPSQVILTPDEARQACDRLDAQGVDFIKVLSQLPREAYFALLERARKWRVPVAGHVPYSVSVDEAIDARQRSMEHLFGVLLACSRDEAKLHKALLANPDATEYRNIEIKIMDTYSEQKAAALFQRMSRFDTWQVPTLTMYRRGPMTTGAAKREYALIEQIVKHMQRAGVPMMAGTDTGDPGTRPGDELHRELELLVEAGLTPLEALRSATLAPARYLDALDSLGSIEKGKLADIVLLDANPLEDIRNTRKIAGVFVRGRFLSKEWLDAEAAREASIEPGLLERACSQPLNTILPSPECVAGVIVKDPGGSRAVKR